MAEIVFTVKLKVKLLAHWVNCFTDYIQHHHLLIKSVNLLNSAPVRAIGSLIAPELALPGQALIKGASIASNLLKQGSHVSNLLSWNSW